MKKISILFYGGLGNQLFQLAFATFIKKNYINSKIELIDLTSYEKIKRKWALNYMGIRPKNISKFNYLLLKIKKFINQKCIKFGINNNIFDIINESQYSKYKDLNSSKKKSIILDGYWQSEFYFYDTREYIKEFFLQYRKGIKFKFQDNETVALHIRLGDYVQVNKSRENHFVCDFEWYLKAINYFYKINNNYKFLIFSNDFKYLKKYFIFPKRINYFLMQENNKDYEDLFKMSYCNHFIISNSSYSWWASYIGEKSNSIIVAPKYWYPNKLTENLGIYRSKWILL